VITVAERTLSTYDAGTLEKRGEIEAGVGPTHLVAGDDDRFYVADTQGDAILVFESAPEPRLLDRANLPGKPYGIAIDNERERLWVTQTARNRVVEYELTDLAPKRLRSFATAQQPNTVAVDPATGYVYVAGRANGELQVFDPERADGSS
jgi:DNA-binding beta-propeller fold protein YncE